jgi:hypothetical protein
MEILEDLVGPPSADEFYKFQGNFALEERSSARTTKGACGSGYI